MNQIFSKSITFLIILVIFIFLPALSISQSWDRYDISYSGCSAAFPYEPEWEISYSPDSSLLWIGETYENEIYYGIICVEFAEPFDYDANEDDLISVAENYLDYLQKEFNVVSHTGYETGYWMESDEVATGVSDSWVDAEGDPWIVMTWIDPFNMAVLYIYANPDISLEEYKDYFFNSLRFPE
jgi:hypothetical protein